VSRADEVVVTGDANAAERLRACTGALHPPCGPRVAMLPNQEGILPVRTCATGSGQQQL